jgi:hypothetical protein
MPGKSSASSGVIVAQYRQRTSEFSSLTYRVFRPVLTTSSSPIATTIPQVQRSAGLPALELLAST